MSASLTIVDTLSSLSNNMQVRDKSVKILQYATRMINGYYKDQLSSSHHKILLGLFHTCSQSRKVFRLGKSILCMQALLSKLTRLPMQKMPETVRELAFCMELLEHVFIGLFFYYDNVLFLGRAKLLTQYKASFWEERTFGAWFLHDFTMFIRKLLLLGCNLQEITQSEVDLRARFAVVGDTRDRHAGVTLVASQNDIEREVAVRLTVLRKARRKLLWEVFKGLIDINVSGGLFASTEPGRAVFSRTIPYFKGGWQDGSIGLFGALSAAMAITDAVAEEVS